MGDPCRHGIVGWNCDPCGRAFNRRRHHKAIEHALRYRSRALAAESARDAALAAIPAHLLSVPAGTPLADQVAQLVNLAEVRADRMEEAITARDAALAQAETDAAHHAAARAAHADLLRNHRAAMEGAEAEIGRLRGALEAAAEALLDGCSNVFGGEDCITSNFDDDDACFSCVKARRAKTALASTATVSVEPAHDCDGVACWVCADQHHAAVEAQAEAQPSDKPDASAEGEG